MSITTIIINTVSYTSYATLVEANERLAVDPVRKATWEALADAAKDQFLVAATFTLDGLDWLGAKTGGEGAQENAWPRTGVTYPDGTAVSTTEVPIEVENATILLAGSIAIKPKTAEQGTTAGNTKRLKAGSAEIEFFSPTDGVALQDATAFDLISVFLGGSTIAANAATGTGETSFTCPPDRDRFGVNKGLA